MKLLHALGAAFAVLAFAQPAGAATDTSDPAHDFDFDLGVWKTHIVRFVDPFAPAKGTMTLDGTVTVRSLWNGKAQLEEIEADGPRGHWEGMSAFLFDPNAKQWSQTFIGSRTGAYSGGMIGRFHDGVARLIGQDTIDGRSILVRGMWSDVTANAHRYREAYSDDGGTTWRPSFEARLTRLAAHAPPGGAVAPPGNASHDFDFDFGNWTMHSERLLHPLTGSHTWTSFDGTTVVRPIWHGRANVAEVFAPKGTGGVDILALRWYGAQSHQWYLDFANTATGQLGVPAAGTFKNGRIDFYDQEPYGGRAILVRFSVWKTPGGARSEQAFSDDSGVTWEVNWRTTYARAV